jgi:hypothetical protein
MQGVLELENKRIALLDDLYSISSVREKLFLINDYLSFLIETGDDNVIHSFGYEFLPLYISCLKSSSLLYIHPGISDKIIKTASFLTELNSFSSYKSELNNSITAAKIDLNYLSKMLNGEPAFHLPKIYFPLLEENDSGRGVMDSVSIQIDVASEKNIFIIIPSEREIEERLSQQVEISWLKAVEFIKQFKVKVKGFHKIYISFDKRLGYYTGNSLGAALFLAFVEELLKFYKSPIIVQTKHSAAITGGLNSNGTVLETFSPVIIHKTEAAFFSDVKYFMLPKSDEPDALKKFNSLKKDYPLRDLKIIPIEDVEDLVNRRDIIDIKKQKTVKRLVNFTRRNPFSLTLLLILFLMVLIYSSVIWDKNPSSYNFTGSILKIKNKMGQVLWTQQMIFSIDNPAHAYYLSLACRIVDINNDGINEVIITYASEGKGTVNNLAGKVICFSAKKDIIWEYIFNDPISTESINHTTSFNSDIIDTVTENGKKVLYLMANNLPLYPMAIYKLDIRTGVRVDIEKTLWHSGGLLSPLIDDFNGDGKMELAVVGVNNGYESAVFFSIQLDKLGGQMPSTQYYTFKDLKKAEYDIYILFPQSDYSYYLRSRMNAAATLFYYKNTKEFEISVREDYFDPVTGGVLIYSLTNDFQLKMIDCCDIFSFNRDDLIRKGKLNPPFTNSYEFFSSLKEKIIYMRPGSEDIILPNKYLVY